jgi:hypothetical protein
MVSPIFNSGAKAHEVAAKKRGEIVRWLLRWDFSDRHVLAELLGLGRSAAYATIAKMVGAGLIGETRVNGCPVPVLHLRDAGLVAAQRLMIDTEDETLTAPVFGSRLNVAHVQHDLLVQRLILDFSRKYPRSLSLSEKQVQTRKLLIGNGQPLSSPKVPDALLILGPSDAQQTWAIELQETNEDRDIAERKLSQYAEAISREELYGLIYASTSPAIVRRIEQIAEGHVRRWWYNSHHKRWYVHSDNHEADPITQEILNSRLIFISRPDLSSTYYQFAVR